MKHKLTELKIGKSTITAGDFNTLLSIMDVKPNRRPKGNGNLNNINQTELTCL